MLSVMNHAATSFFFYFYLKLKTPLGMCIQQLWLALSIAYLKSQRQASYRPEPGALGNSITMINILLCQAFSLIDQEF